MQYLVPCIILGLLFVVYMLTHTKKESMSDTIYIQDLSPSAKEIRPESDMSLEGVFAAQIVKDTESPVQKIENVLHQETLTNAQVKHIIDGFVSKTPKTSFNFKLVELSSFTQTRDGSLTAIVALHDVYHSFTREFIFKSIKTRSGFKLASVKLNMNDTDVSGVQPVMDGTKNLNTFAEWTPPI